MAPIKSSSKEEYDFVLCQLVAKAVTGRPFYGVTDSSKKRAHAIAVPFIKQWIANPFSIAPEYAQRLKNSYDDVAILMRMGWLNAVNSINDGSYSADTSSTGVTRANAVDHGDMEEDNTDGVTNYVPASVASISCDSVAHAVLPTLEEENELEAADAHLAADVDQSVPSSIRDEDDEDQQQEGYVDGSGRFIYLDLEDDVFGGSALSAKALFEASVAGKETLPAAGCRETFIKNNGEVFQERDLEKMDFVAILQHISAKYFHSMASETEFLQMLHRFKPAINYSTLPQTGRQLMKVLMNRDNNF